MSARKRREPESLPLEAATLAVSKVAVSSIEADDEADRDNVARLAESFGEVGQITPIGVVRKDNGFRLIRHLGRDRLAAAIEVGWADIDVFIHPNETEADALRTELISIDEGLYRKKISPAEEAILTARRKVIYEALHPETKQGVAGGKARQGSANENSSFAENQASTTGKTPRSVQMSNRRGAVLGAETLERLIGTSLDKGDELDALIELPEEQREAIVEAAAAGEKVSAKLKLEQHNRNLREMAVANKILEYPGELAGVIYSDFPWKTINYSDETGSNRAAENHYVTMDLDDIEKFPWEKFAAPDCYHLAWTTGPFLAIAIRLFEIAGFTYRARIVWVKDKRGNGKLVIDQAEELLIFARGHPVAPARGTQPLSVNFADSLDELLENGGHIEAERTEHSKKPDAFAEMIEHYWPNTPKRELFSRGATRPGWLKAWGNEVTDESAGDPVAEGIDGDGPGYQETDDTPADRADPAVASSEEASSVMSGLVSTDGAVPENGEAAKAAPSDQEATPESITIPEQEQLKILSAVDAGMASGVGINSEHVASARRSGLIEGRKTLRLTPIGEARLAELRTLTRLAGKLEALAAPYAEPGGQAADAGADNSAANASAADPSDPFATLTYVKREPPKLPDFDGERDLPGHLRRKRSAA